MAKQSKSKKPDNLGNGSVTPVQIAFLVDQYLSDNSYTQSRSLFRAEASSLFSKSPIREVPKSLLSLSEILNEYIALKEQKVMVDHEKVRVEQEKSRVQTLLNGLQNSMNVYNVGGNPQISKAPDVAPKQMLLAPQSRIFTGSSAGQKRQGKGSLLCMFEVLLLKAREVLTSIGRTTKAVDFYHCAIALLESSRGAESEDLVIPLFGLGSLLLKQGKPIEAETLFLRFNFDSFLFRMAYFVLTELSWFV